MMAVVCQQLLAALLVWPASAVLVAKHHPHISKWELKSERSPTGPFKNVMLVVHCRKSMSICKERWSLYEPYLDYFGSMMMLHRENCDDDASMCLMRLIQYQDKGYDGIFYMHFDAILNPCALAPVFNKDAVGWFVEPGYHSLSPNLQFTKSPVKDDTIFGVEWTNKTAASFAVAMKSVQEKLASDLHGFDASTVYTSENDLFYIPRAAFKSFPVLAQSFAENGVWHEVAGPTMRKVLQKNLQIPAVNFDCKGACCQNLAESDISSESFRCGHRFDMREPVIIDAMNSMLSKCKASQLAA